MRIAQIHNRYREPGGEDGVAEREAAVLRGRGHDVLSLGFDNPEGRLASALTVARSRNNRSSVRRVRNELKQFLPDVVHIHNTWFTASDETIKAASKFAAVVQTSHNYRMMCLNAQLFRNGEICTDCVGSHLLRGVSRSCYRGSRVASVELALTNHTHRRRETHNLFLEQLLTLSDFASDLLVESGIERGRLARHNNFAPDPGQRSQAAVSSKDILAVGRLSPEKGFAELIGAWATADTGDLRLLVIGDGPERDKLEQLATMGIEFLGRQSAAEVRSWMLKSRALVFPSRWYEGQPLVLLEALAAGLPIATSNQPPLREILDGSHQLVVEEEWSTSLATLTDDSWVNAASARARERFEDRYTESVAINRLENIYADAIRSWSAKQAK